MNRALRILCGGEVDRELSAILFVTLFSTIAFSAWWSYVGVWAISALGATPTQVGTMFLVAALAAAPAAPLGGHLADRVGRRMVMVAGWAGQSFAIVALATVAGHLYLSLALVAIASTFGSSAFAASTVMVADLVPVGRQERAYSVVRIVFNVGSALGPPLAGLFVLAGHWSGMFVGVGTLGILTAATAYATLPRLEHTTARARSAGATLHAVVSDRAFLLLLASTALGFFVFVCYSAALPIVAVSSYGVSPALWGLIAAVNPLAVIVFQLRLTIAVERIGAAAKLVTAMALMGLPFLLLVLVPGVGAVITIALVFVIGEMLWAPTSQTLAAQMAGPSTRGAYIGAFRGASQFAWAVAPITALRLQAVGGGLAWFFVVIVAACGAAAGAAACWAARCRLGKESRRVKIPPS